MHDEDLREAPEVELLGRLPVLLTRGAVPHVIHAERLLFQERLQARRERHLLAARLGRDGLLLLEGGGDVAPVQVVPGQGGLQSKLRGFPGLRIS